MAGRRTSLPVALRARRALRSLRTATLLLAALLLAGVVTAATSDASDRPLGRHSSGGELIQVGRNDSIVLSVNAETSSDMVGVDIDLPAGFTPDRQMTPDARGGGVGGVFITWQAQYAGQRIVAGGSGVANGGVVLMTFSGAGSHVGTLSFVTVTHAEDGTTVRWDGPADSKHPAALVYVVRSVPNVPGAASLSSKGFSLTKPPPWALGVAVGIGLVLVVGFVRSRRRRRS